jgi:hypothetical protein
MRFDAIEVPCYKYAAASLRAKRVSAALPDLVDHPGS